MSTEKKPTHTYEDFYYNLLKVYTRVAKERNEAQERVKELEEEHKKMIKIIVGLTKQSFPFNVYYLIKSVLTFSWHN